MTPEDKQLLLKDLCARLPYGVICDRLGHPKKLLAVNPYKKFQLELDSVEYIPSDYKLEDIKPYLRPMSSMTEEEAFEMFNVIYPIITPLTFESLNYGIKFTGTNKEGEYKGDYKRIILFFDRIYSLGQIDWLNAHHFDYRGLIEKGIALEAPEGMYKEE